ncbi:DEAD/DEAH box helicase [Corynebacterium sp. P7202]|uniref:DNA 3'-5' helicase n=1 Tax=Corynebacterium pygosceleis TaxID=2800406 RepID=A0A9Q4C6M4_9CORY|nr:UvrD-helicase domain-containing protein [Corynebacterium pygosceleis]MCK7637735.1 DEAD/DEAH box helicase [Corynebacterium pygosceleis]MCX7444725.1 UvrD-helicase domain-containing protein [Corynebacterium pygosceleis]MCX7467936.1 UvrD-helicase domain-containing protein [Corynebacterium pygosceleis]
MSAEKLSPVLLSRWLGQEHAPTDQQAAIISADPGPLLVVAGAGAGKTETMAARVVWLVASGLAAPDQVLGLTFTRKAAQQLSQRIRARLATLAGIPRLRDLDPTGTLEHNLRAITPTVSTYDSYAGRLIGEYGLLLPVEPSARLITRTELFQIAWDLVGSYRGELPMETGRAHVVDTLLALSADMDNHMVDATGITEETLPFVSLFEELPPGPRQKEKLAQKTANIRDRQLTRLALLPLVEQLRAELSRRNVITFGEQMSLAARLASTHPEVGYSQRRRFRVVMLDEYQDTSHAQRVLLSSLFGGTDPSLTVTAVGDPMQSIYGWRGATAANLTRFVTDFPRIDRHDPTTPPQPAPKMELVTSWRNPPEILTAANAVSRGVLGPENIPDRAVQPLRSRPGAPAGVLRLGWFADAATEIGWIADRLADDYAERRENGRKFTGAVLVRKRKHSAAIAAALGERGVPVEIVGLAGLLDIPEVADLVAFATMLVRPGDNRAALRILTGPHVGLGGADVLALADRAANLAGRATGGARRQEPPDTDAVDRGPDDPALARLHRIISETLPTGDDTATAGLTDAVADLGEPERYSAGGLIRLRRLAAHLRYLRTHSLGHDLSEIFGDIERITGIRTEILSRTDPHADGAAGTVHLDRFHEHVASFAQIPGTGLRSLLDHLSLAREQEEGLEPGEVRVNADRVQILTVHKAKGLEWDTVAVLHADNRTYTDASSPRVTVETWLTDITKVPATLRGDARDDADDPVGSPVLDTVDAENRKDLENAMEEHRAQFRTALEEENTRLFYVALTRSERLLYITGSETNDTGTTAAPYVHVDEIRRNQPGSVVHWHETEPEAPTENSGSDDGGDTPDAVFPPEHLGARADAVRGGAELVRAAAVEPPPPGHDGDIEELWEQEVSALIEEQRRLDTPVVDVEIGRELTASDLVAVARDATAFARRLRRPVPFKPNTYAKRGTALHQWIEDRYGATGLLDEDELPGLGEEDIRGPELARLKEAFLASAWAQRTPEHVEQPFEITIGGHVVRGRMDAVFHDGDDPTTGWMVVDWKTGRPPTGPDLGAAVIQLAVYRLAWAQLLSRRTGRRIDPAEIRAAFHYIGSDHTLEPGKLPDAGELAQLL